jgi:hypothetical protein
LFKSAGKVTSLTVGSALVTKVIRPIRQVHKE